MNFIPKQQPSWPQGHPVNVNQDKRGLPPVPPVAPAPIRGPLIITEDETPIAADVYRGS